MTILGLFCHEWDLSAKRRTRARWRYTGAVVVVRFFSFLHAVVGIMAVIAWWSVPWLPGFRAGMVSLLPGGPGFVAGGLWGILGLLFTWLTWKELRGRAGR